MTQESGTRPNDHHQQDAVAIPRRRKLLGRHLCSALVFFVAFPVLLRGQSDPTYVQFTPPSVKGALYSPDTGLAPEVAILAIHRTANYMGYRGCRELAQRGYLVLCMNPRSDNNESRVRWERLALDVRSGITFLREQPGIRNVLLWGFSGGGGTTSFYQAVAETGVSFCQGPNKLTECTSDLDDLPPADGLILVDTSFGIAHMAVARLNGAVVNDFEIFDRNAAPVIDPELDPFSSDNGYRPDGASAYSQSFQDRYFRAQSQRMNRLIEIAQEKLRAIEERADPFPDDDVFLIPMAETAELLSLDPSIHHSTVARQKLLTNSGEVVRQIVESVRLPDPGLRDEHRTFAGGMLMLTVRSFLSANAMRSSDSMNDVDYCSSNNSVPCAVQAISAPLLITAMQANRYLRFNEIHYELAKSEDKDFVIVEGATHGQTPCVACEDFPGQYSNATENFFDYVSNWIDARY